MTPKMTNSNNRIGYIDALRGFTMLLVLFSHLYIPNITPLNKCFVLFRMPLFFFVSGFISMRREQAWELPNLVTRVGGKVRTMVVSAIGVGLIYAMVCNAFPITNFFTHPYKMGYWFTLALFNMLVVYYVARYLHARRRGSSVQSFVGWFMALGILNFVLHIYGAAHGVLGRVLTLDKTVEYMHFFAFGVLCSYYRDTFNRIARSVLWVILAAVLFFAILYGVVATQNCIGYEIGGYGTHWGYLLNTIIVNGAGILGILCVYAIFLHLADFFSRNGVVARSMQYVGRNTLDIYLLHYFVLLGFPMFLYPYVIGTTNILIQIVVGFTAAAVVMAVTLLLSRIIRLNDHLAYYLLGARDVKLRSKR